MIAQNKVGTWIANIQRHARIVGVGVRDSTRRSVHYESSRFYFDVGGTVQPVRRSRSS